MKNEEYIWLAEFLNGKQIVAIGNDKAGALRSLHDRVQHDFKGRVANMDFNEFITLSTVKVTPMISVEGLFNNEKESEQMNREEALKNRIDIITGKAERDRAERIRKLHEEQDRIEAMLDNIRDMKDRIQDIIKLANICVDNGIKIPMSEPFNFDCDAGSEYGYPYEFIAEGWAHHVGLISECCRDDILRRKYKFKYIGIENGGACGCYDFWTNGNVTMHIHETNRKEIKVPSEHDLKKFLDEFPKFEKGFLNWIDSLRA